MIKIKRILALLICTLLAITSLPVTQLVYADDLVVIQEDSYSSVDDITWTFGNNDAGDGKVFIQPSVESGSYRVNLVNTSGSGTNKLPFARRTFGDMTIDTDTDKRTTTTTNALQGKYEYEFDLGALVKKHADANAGNAIIFFQTPANNTVLGIRFEANAISVYDGTSANSGYNYLRSRAGNGVWQAGETEQKANLKIVLDTVSGAVESYFNGALMDKYQGKEPTIEGSEIAEARRNKPISSLLVQFTSRMDSGSYVCLDTLKITKINDAADETLALLPETLVSDVNNVTEQSVTLPQISGVTWSSADESVAKVSGDTLTFLPSETETKEAKVTATFKLNNGTYNKNYEMTVAIGEAVDPGEDEPEFEPDIVPDPDNDIPDWVEVFGTKKNPGTLVDSHGFSNTDVNGRKIYNGYSDTTDFKGTYSADAFTLSRVTKLASGTGGKLSNELMRLNLTKKVDDAYEYGLEGAYVIDLKVNGAFTSAMKLSDVYLDGYLVASGNPDDLKTANDTNVKTRFVAEKGKTGNTFFQVMSASDSSLTTQLAPIPANIDTIIRLVIDAESGNLALYTSEDNKETFKFYGAIDGVYNADKIAGFIFNPGLGLIPDSDITFKNIDIYQVSVKKFEYCTVSYYVDGGVFEEATVPKGTAATAISAPAKDNFIFKGWFAEGAEAAFDFDTLITGDLNLYAEYEGVLCNVVFMKDGEPIKTLQGHFGEPVEGGIPEVPKKTGYTAIGWYVGDTGEMFTSATVINSTNMIVNAKYADSVLDTYTVTFVVDGNQYAKEDAVDGYAVSNVPANPEKPNHTFEGWLLNGAPYDMSTPVTGDITLTASFKPEEYDVKFFMDNTYSELYFEGVVTYGEAYGQLPIPTKETFKFLGWKTADGETFTSDTVITGDINVYAEWESTIKVVMDEDVSAYNGLTGNIVEFAHSGPATALSFNNGAQLTWFKEMPTSRSFDNTLLIRFKIPYGEADAENRTQMFNNKLVGDYEVEVAFDVKLSDNSWHPEMGANPYGYISTGYSSGGVSINAILSNRVNPTAISTYNSAAANDNTFNSTGKKGESDSYAYSKAGSGTTEDGGYKDVTVRIRYNTDTKLAQMSANGYNNVAKGSVMSTPAGINAIRYNMMNCFEPGNYIRIKNIKVTQYSDNTANADYQAAISTISSLPDSIVAEGDSPFAVTQTLDIPEVTGVVWTSSNSDAVNASSGEIRTWYDSQEVSVFATVNVGDYSFSKEYKLTIKADESIAKEILHDQTFASDADMANWTFVSLADGKVADYSVDEKGVKIGKITAPEVSNSNVEQKRYFAFYDLYTQTKADSYTTTSTKDVKGVYDVTLNVSDYVATSKVPMNVGVGYRKGTTFYPYGSLVFDGDGATFTYNYDTETVKEVDLGSISKDSLVKIRVDNVLGEVALFVDDEIKLRETCFTGLGENPMINSVRMAIDVNNEIGDGVTIKGIKLEKVVANDIPALANVISAADMLSIGVVTSSDPDSVSGLIKELPETIGGYNINWKSSSNQIDVETREIFHAAEAKSVVISAEIYDADAQYPVVVRKDFKLTVRKASTDEELGRFEIAQLGKITNQSYSDIRYDLNLPTAEGVEWVSLNTDIISHDGKISDTITLTEATPVTIIAKSKGIEKPYNLVVAPRTAMVELTGGTAPFAIKLGEIENAKISSDITAKFNYKHTSANTGKIDIVSDNGHILVSMVATATGIYFDYKSSDYKEVTLADGQTVPVEIMIMPDVDKVAVFVNNELVVDYADLKEKADYVSSVNTSNAGINTGVVTLLVNKFGMLKANVDNFDYFADASTGFATSAGIVLPEDIVTSGKVTWTSSNESLLKNDGSVIVPESLTYANLEFRITDLEDSSIYIKEDFRIAVDCAAANNLISGITPNISNLDSTTYPPRNATDNNIDTAMLLADANKADSQVVLNFGSQKTLNSLFLALAQPGIENYEIYSTINGSEWDKIAEGNFGENITGFIEFDTTAATSIKLVINKTAAKDIYINEIKAYLSATADELALIDIDLITVPAKASSSKINLPTIGVNGTAISWATSDSSIIDAQGNVTRPSTSTTVTLTATVMSNGQPVTRSFPVYVDSKASSDGPTHVGGGSGGGGGGGGAGGSAGSGSAPVIGTNENETVYAEDLRPAVDTNSKLTYTDVNADNWYYEDVMALTEAGVISGDGSGFFNPTDKVTREQFVKMILEAVDVEITESSHSFGDVVDGAWYEGYVATAVKHGVVNGIAADMFGVGTNITRQDMAVLIERVLNFKQVEIEKTETSAFADAEMVSSYAAEAVANMKAIGLIQGFENKFNPKDNLTRAEAATVIASLLKLLAK